MLLVGAVRELILLELVLAIRHRAIPPEERIPDIQTLESLGEELSNFGNSSVELSFRMSAPAWAGCAGAEGFRLHLAVAAGPQPSPASVLPAGIDDRRTTEALSLHLRFSLNKAWPFCLEQVILISVHIVLRPVLQRPWPACAGFTISSVVHPGADGGISPRVDQQTQHR